MHKDTVTYLLVVDRALSQINAYDYQVQQYTDGGDMMGASYYRAQRQAIEEFLMSVGIDVTEGVTDER